MDAFLTAAQKRLKQTVRDFFREADGPADAVSGADRLGRFVREEGDPRPGYAGDALLGRLDENGFGGLFGRKEGPGCRLASSFEAALALEEIAAASPALALTFAEPRGDVSADRTGAAVALAETARLLGTSAFILRACYRAARAKGLFESTLMACSEGQQGLADALVALDACRLRAYRAFVLACGPAPGSGESELVRLLPEVHEAAAAARALGAAHLGEDWCRAHIPPGPPAHERKAT